MRSVRIKRERERERRTNGGSGIGSVGRSVASDTKAKGWPRPGIWWLNGSRATGYRFEYCPQCQQSNRN